MGSLKGLDARKAAMVMGIMTLHAFSEGLGVGVSYGGANGRRQVRVCGGVGGALPSSPRARPNPFVCAPRVHRPAAGCGRGVPLKQYVCHWSSTSTPLPFLICSIRVHARAQGASQLYAPIRKQ